MSFIDDFKEKTNTKAVEGSEKRLEDSLLVRPKVLAEKVLKSNVISCSITLPDPVWQNKTLTRNTVTIPFYMSSDFSFSMGNNWKPLISSEDMGGVFTYFLNAIQGVKKDTQVTMQSQAMSTCVWNGSTFDGFNLNNCLFICTNRSINPVKIIEKIAKSCLPQRLDDWANQGGGVPGAYYALASGAKGIIKGGANLVKGVVGFIGDAFNQDTNSMKKAVDDASQTSQDLIDDVGMVAPFGYGVSFEGNDHSRMTPIPGTTVSFRIGNWFYATELVVESLSGITFSKELIAPARSDNKSTRNDLYNPAAQGTDFGFPLYVSVNIKLKPYALVDLRKFSTYFIHYNEDGTNMGYWFNEAKNNVDDVNNLFNL